MRPEQRAGHEVAEYRAEAEALEHRHREHAREQEHQGEFETTTVHGHLRGESYPARPTCPGSGSEPLPVVNYRHRLLPVRYLKNKTLVDGVELTLMAPVKTDDRWIDYTQYLNQLQAAWLRLSPSRAAPEPATDRRAGPGQSHAGLRDRPGNRPGPLHFPVHHGHAPAVGRAAAESG
ncbi:MAG: hypothetical protein BroJett010_15860 [Gammaproteobacteria bacterium]|nr:MAG: hypothetical protein BroJett010_15860 [Gammaproteobacteria bacterium]